MEHSQLLNIIQRPLSPDTRLEVPASREEYERVNGIIEREESKYPQLWYDSMRSVAIVVAPPTPLHSGMTGALLSTIYKEVIFSSGISPEITRNLGLYQESASNGFTSRGLTTRAADGTLRYHEGNRSTLMIAVEVGVSQSYDSLRAAISWSVCALRCRLGIAMSISEGSRGQKPQIRYYASIEEINAAAGEAEVVFRQQLLQYPYGPLVRYGATWFGRVRQVVLETYRGDDESAAETLLEPQHSFTIVQNGEFVGHSISPNLREVVLEDCIPSHLLNGQDVQAVPVNFFYREWFESKFQDFMVQTAVTRVRRYSELVP
ncbi:uncharacterized protein V1513DRAFT_421902 [Lipomyces chichibuensis]|uniref:uncharacterized protein n=1 Tax=Lipomyces chichibuensis TaxID=1546026 RepID=UPI0033436BC1